MASGARDGTQAASWGVITGTYQSVRSRNTDFGQVGFEPQPMLTALQLAFYLNLSSVLTQPSQEVWRELALGERISAFSAPGQSTGLP